MNQVLDGNLPISDDFVQFDVVRFELVGERLEISFISDGKVAAVVDEVMILKNGWSVEVSSTVSFKVGVKID